MPLMKVTIVDVWEIRKDTDSNATRGKLFSSFVFFQIQV